MAIELSNRPVTPGEEMNNELRLVMFDPNATPGTDGRVKVANPDAIADLLIALRKIDPARLEDLTIDLSPVAWDAEEDTVIGTISGNNPNSTLTVLPEGIFKLDTSDINAVKLVKGAVDPTLAGLQYVTITETLTGSANSPLTTTAQVEFTAEPIEEGQVWRADSNPEWLMNAYAPEFAPAGKLAAWPGRGVRAFTATQNSESKQPTNLPDGSGVFFEASSGQHMNFSTISDALNSNRIFVAIWKVDTEVTNASHDLFSVNDGTSSGERMPRLMHHTTDGLHLTKAGIHNSTTTQYVFKDETPRYVTDGSKWNIVILDREEGQLRCRLNGVDLGPITTIAPASTLEAFLHNYVVNSGVLSRIGEDVASHPAFILNYVATLHGEHPQGWYLKLEGWAHHRVGQQGDLPDGHPYKVDHPLIGEDDLPYFWPWDETWWTEYRPYLEANNNDLGDTREFIGEDAINDYDGYALVANLEFHDPAMLHRSEANTTGIPRAVIYAPGWNTGIARNTIPRRPQDSPSVYEFTSEGDGEEEIRFLRMWMKKEGSNFYSSQWMTVDNAGRGRYWGGPRIEEVRMRFPARVYVSNDGAGNELSPGCFPAPLWRYGREHLLWRSRLRVEFDHIELDGNAPGYFNSGSLHPHTGQFDYGYHDHDGFHSKVFGGTLTEGRTGVPGGIQFWDGEWRTVRFVFTEETTYCEMTIPDGEGGEKFIEIWRCPTIEMMLLPGYLLSAYTLFNSRKRPDEVNVPRDDEWYDIEWMRVWYPEDRLTIVAEPFTARPTIGGTSQEGETLTCAVNLPEGVDYVCDWSIGGQPLWRKVNDNTFVIPTGGEYVGLAPRCEVTAIGHIDRPQAWTADYTEVIEE